MGTTPTRPYRMESFMPYPRKITGRKQFAVALGIACLACQLPAHALTAQATLFDTHTANGLPQAFSLPRADDDPRGPGADDIDVLTALDVDVELPDGSHVRTWLGNANGRQAMFTRINDELNVEVMESPDGGDMPGRRTRRSPELEFGLADMFLAPATRPSQPPRAGADLSAKGQLQFWVFLHDASGETDYAKFHNWYLSWWLRDLKAGVLIGTPVRVIVRDQVPGVTDFDYHRGSQVESLLAFRDAADAYLDKSAGPAGKLLRKTMLFVDSRPDSWISAGDYGIALQENTVAMASGTGPRHVVAHEFGHTLGAVHEAATSWVCGLSNMKGYILGRFACGYYTEENMGLIRSHVAIRLTPDT